MEKTKHRRNSFGTFINVGRALLAALVLVLVAAFAGPAGYAASAAQGQTVAVQPNIVYVVTDDMRKDDLNYMPKTRSLIFDQGITYNNAFTTTSQCCPSRSSVLTGKYVHNHKVTSNSAGVFAREGNPDHTIAVWLHNAGYTTMLSGKYLNGFTDDTPPPGWDEFHGFGNIVYYDADGNYSTDVIRDQAKDFIDRQQGSSQPFFMYLAPVAPHTPATPAARHSSLFPSAKSPRPPSFNEEDVSDKPAYISSLGKADELGIDQRFRKRIRSLQAVDEMVEATVNELRATGKLDNTYIVFSSDNGWMQGEHRLARDKNAPYEPSIRIPLGIRGPGIPAGRSTDQMALNIDFAATFAEWGGAKASTKVDGRSLVPTLQADAPIWRKRFLEEYWGTGNTAVPPHTSVRSATKKYILYEDGFEELYDLKADPDEMDNLEKTQPGVDDSALAAKLETLKACSGQLCRDAENR